MNQQHRLKFQIDFSEDEVTEEIVTLNQIDDQLRFEDRYELVKTLGEGAHAIVKLAKHKGTGSRYAVKVVRSSDEQIQNNVKRCFNNTRCLRHPNIIQDIELFMNERLETSYLIMEYCAFPTLDSILKERTLQEEEIRLVIRQLLLAVQHAHSKGISHRDLKPDNILVNLTEQITTPTTPGERSTLKVVDFGVSKRFQSKGVQIPMSTKTGNINYCAPEIYHSNTYSKEIDIWSIGVIMFQCATGRLPLYSDDGTQAFVELLGKPQQWNFQEHLRLLPLSLQNLITQLLAYDPKDRITISDALDHPFFQLHSLKDIISIVTSQTHFNYEKDSCMRCRSLQLSLKFDNKWDKVIKTIHEEQESDVTIENLIQEVGNIHTLQKHGDQCTGIIQLMESLGNSNHILTRLSSRQESLQKSIGLDLLETKTLTVDPFSEFGKVYESDDISPKNFQAKLGGTMEQSIDVSEEITNDKRDLADFWYGIKEVDEDTEV